MEVLWTYGVEAGKISRQKLVDIFSSTPAKNNGLFPRKGSLSVGADADIVIFDPAYRGYRNGWIWRESSPEYTASSGVTRCVWTRRSRADRAGGAAADL